MFKDVVKVFYPIYFELEKIPIIISLIVFILIIVITIYLVKKELKRIC